MGKQEEEPRRSSTASSEVGHSVNGSEQGHQRSVSVSDAHTSESEEAGLLNLQTANESQETSTSGRCSAITELCSKVQGLIWNNGLASIAGASLIMGINALLVKLVVARVPVFEIVLA
ncbi:hypothetical protein WJX73_005976 [Symbiochloris irregularis]|uniref:Uncharacterized protein n=1 Tax=Symbiochloris irregularis TaxID=706552 RepID=A0AAW1PY75_9CHLO